MGVQSESDVDGFNNIPMLDLVREIRGRYPHGIILATIEVETNKDFLKEQKLKIWANGLQENAEELLLS